MEKKWEEKDKKKVEQCESCRLFKDSKGEHIDTTGKKLNPSDIEQVPPVKFHENDD